MNKQILISGLIVIALLISKHSCAQTSNQHILTISKSIGYQQENFNWSIAGDTDGKNPNIYSELKWSKLRLPTMQLGVSVKPWKNIFIKTTFSYGLIKSGSVNDRDYLGDDRTKNIYDGTYKSNEGSIQATEFLAGYTFLSKMKFSITPYLGYGFNKQQLYILGADANQKLKSTYTTYWNGSLVGTDLRINVGNHFIFESGFTYHQLVYKSEANWNLIDKFKHPISFRQHANAFKLEATTKVYYKINNQFSIYIQANKSYWKTGIGTDTLYLSDGTTSLTRFNGASRNSIYGGVGITWSPF